MLVWERWTLRNGRLSRAKEKSRRVRRLDHIKGAPVDEHVNMVNEDGNIHADD